MTSPAGMVTTCRTCGKKIAFGRLGNGRLIPLDLVAPVYALFEDGTTCRASEGLVAVNEAAYRMAVELAGQRITGYRMAVELAGQRITGYRMAVELAGQRITGYYVSHFATCPQASEHSKSKKKETVEQKEAGDA